MTCDHGWLVPEQVAVWDVKIIKEKAVVDGLTSWWVACLPSEWKKDKNGCSVSILVVQGAAFECWDWCLAHIQLSYGFFLGDQISASPE